MRTKESTADNPELSGELRSILDALAHAPSWPLADTLSIAPGDRIGKYVLESIIGRGGFGVVFQAHDEALGRRVAIKVTRGEPTPEVLARFQDEARIAARLNHPNLITLHDSGTIEGLPYLVLELLDGETLAERLSRAPLPVADALAITADVLRAIARVHAEGIIHLDIKPGNVFVTRDGRIKLLDFGLAQLRERTIEGKRAGTPGYMAPEQWRGERSDARSDLYAIGAMLFEMTTGELRKQPDRSLAPAPIRALLGRAMASDPADRFASAEAMLAAVDAVRAPKRRPTRFAWLAAIAIAAPLAIAIVQMRGRNRAVEAAQIAERAGREASAIEADLRYARLQPLHDIRPDEARARDRLRALARDVEAAGGDARDAAEVALAHAERALGELGRARERLERVIDRDRTPAAVAARGEVLLDQYVERRHDVELDADRDQRKAALDRLDAELREPALRDLREAAATTPFELARIALLERRYDDARRFAGNALAASPGQYEATALIGDTYAAEASDAEDRGDRAAVIADADRAGEAYAGAIAIARSDPALYAADCRRHSTAGRAQVALGQDGGPSYAAATAACARALVARPDDATATIDGAFARNSRAQELEQKGGDALPILAEALDLVARARAVQPENAELLRMEGMLLFTRAYVEVNHDVDPRDTMAAATRAYMDQWLMRPDGDAPDRLGQIQSMLAEYQLEHGIDPTPSVERALALLRHRDTPSILVTVGRALVARANWQVTHRGDPRPSLDEAVDAFEKARKLRPTDSAAADEEGGAWQTRAEWERRAGLDWIASLERAIACSDAVLALDPNDLTGNNNMGEELAARAEAEHERGGDPWPFLERALAHVAKASAIDPSAAAPLVNLGSQHELEARWQIEAGKDPSAALATATAALAKAQGLSHDDLTELPIECDLELDRGVWQVHAGTSPADAFGKARAACEHALELDPPNVALNEKTADLLRAIAAWKHARGEDATREITEGLRRIRLARAAGSKVARDAEIQAALVALEPPDQR
ncbi:MAG TPA: protein kinase [Kofleriaceae bacterium]|nr:protein kinase [Kofleriaceae bacterium]